MFGLFEKKPLEVEKYVVKSEFVIMEWADSHGMGVNVKTVPVGAEIRIQSNKKGSVKRMWIDGCEYGKYMLLATKDEITLNCLSNGAEPL